MKISLITQYYPPEIGAPQARLSEHVREWITQGHEVFVLTAFPGHPNGILPQKYKGKIYLKEKGDWGEEIIRHWTYITPNKGFFKRTIGHLSFMFSLSMSVFSPKRDIYLVSSPTFFAAIGAWLLSKIRNTPFVFEVRDLWPGIFVELGILKNNFLISLLERIELFLYRQAKLVVVVTDGFKDNLVSRGINPHKIKIITNGVWVENFNRIHHQSSVDTIQHEFNLKGKYIILYIGAHGISQNLSFILEAAKKLQLHSEIIFMFVGEGAEKDKLMSTANNLQLANCIFLPGVPREKALAYYHLCDIALIPLRDIPGFKSFIPSKMFEIMASKKPFVASVQGESATILKQSRGGIVVPPENVELLIDAILTIKNVDNAKLLGQNGFDFVRLNYDRQVLAQNYLEILKEVVTK